MYQLDITKRFKRAYDKLDSNIQDEVDEAIKALIKGRPYPRSLRVKKMKGHKSILEASPTMSIRMTFQYNNPDYIVLRNVGSHDITLSKP
ncbi:type II toxin-antitoxin system YafQ family toxin [Nosocomiicoccus ampullae]|uniref:type II toxin-antitoxin system RelE/ParE family toxin n=1 Tax=Nosocomiicoccus ampullae TaxID=489910 RepID=UPI0025519727|nr:cytotoxin [Nosocomiicoccus ampullae]MDK6864151.1 cytotoxin [Nosocomiicoccus ampullae]